MSVRGIVLAAGKGTRMKSGRSKVLHEICGRPMLWYVISALRDAGVEDVVVVSNPELHDYIAGFDARSIIQQEQLGTGHAVQIALAQMQEQRAGRIVVAYGDMPLIGEDIFRTVLQALDAGKKPALALVTVQMPLPSNFGRVIRNGPGVRQIVEVRDASEEQLRVDEMNAGIYAYDEGALREAVAALRNDNAQKEYYLTDTIEKLATGGKGVAPVRAADHTSVLGINDRTELAVARREMNDRLCARYMRDGVTIVDPATTYLEPELQIGRDTVIYP
ncbi:MAG: NTP transferase domain-containing protein, partial [Candidatus Eremiobacteraeota bacterium]|nr:NTP transferase domain-containing protein [Candidatus Eremiobacteraeota bacterium]